GIVAEPHLPPLGPVLLGIEGSHTHGEVIGRVPKNVAPDQRVVPIAVTRAWLVPGRNSSQVTVALVTSPSPLGQQRILHERQIDREPQIATIEAPDARFEVGAELLGRKHADVLNRAAIRVPSEERALRTAQHLDAFHIDEVRLQNAQVALPHAVQIYADTGYAANA